MRRGLRDKLSDNRPTPRRTVLDAHGRALSVPYAYWGIGGIDPATYRRAVEAGRASEDIPVNHSPMFAPVIQPTLDTGTQAMVTAALAWLTSGTRDGACSTA